MKKNEKINVVYIAGLRLGGEPDMLTDFLRFCKEEDYINPIVFFSNFGDYEIMLRGMDIEYYKLDYLEFSRGRSVGLFMRVIEWLLHPLVCLRFMIYDRKALLQAESYVDLKKIDVIHCNNDRIDLGALIAKKYQIPHIWHLREHVKGHMKLIFKRTKPAWFMNCNTNQFIAVSQSVKKEWESWGLEKEKIKVVYDGEDWTQIIENKGLFKQKIIKIVFVGTLYREKGQFDVLKSLAKMSEKDKSHFCIDFVGRGKKKFINKLKRFCMDEKINATFLGYRGNINELLRDYDIGINASKKEGFGRTTIEYMASGLLTIGKDCGGSREIIENGVDGVLFKDSDDLAAKLISIYNNKDKYRNLAVAGKKKVLNKFTIEKNVRNIYNIYKSVVILNKR